MKRLLSYLTISFLLSFLAFFSFTGPFVEEAAADTKTLKIGIITSITGPMAPAFKPIFDAAKPGETASRGEGESQGAQDQVCIAEETELIGCVVGPHPECDGDQSAECQPAHHPATRLQSKEKRATAAATMERPTK